MGIAGTEEDWESPRVPEGVTGGYSRVTGGYWEVLWFEVSLCLQECPPRVPHVPTTVPVLPCVLPVCPSCVSLCRSGVSRDVPLSPTGMHVSLGMSPVVSPGCPLWISVFPLCVAVGVPQDVPLSLHPPMGVPCASCVTPECLHILRVLFPLDGPTEIPMSFIDTCVSP